MSDAIVVTGLRKHFGKVKALDDLNLTVRHGTVHALLGPNGAGKTTAVRVLTTLLQPDAGKAMIYGADVTTQQQQVRAWIALTGQRTATDSVLTGRENLELIGRLRRLDAGTARRRAAELLELFELTDATNRPVRTYSGGMRRRLDLAMSLVTRPRVLFLDEPTTNLDPRSRYILWTHIERFAHADGTTVVLTTQHLDEADRLADHVSVIDHGRTIADGTPAQLKTQASGNRIEVTLARAADLQSAGDVLRRHGDGNVSIDGAALRLVIPVDGYVGVLPRLVRDLDEAGVEVADLALRRPTLDDAFMALTGHQAEPLRGQPAGLGAARG